MDLGQLEGEWAEEVPLMKMFFNYRELQIYLLQCKVCRLPTP